MIRKAGLLAVLATMTTLPTMAADCRKTAEVLDKNPNLERSEPFKESGTTIYIVHLEQGGGLNLSCGGAVPDIVVGTNTKKPSQDFVDWFGSIAHDALGADRRDAIAFALQCHNDASQKKGDKHGLFFGDPIEKGALHVDCRVGDKFTSFGVFRRP